MTDHVKAVTPAVETVYKPVELKLGTTFRFVGESTRDSGADCRVYMVVRVVGAHDGLLFSNRTAVKWGWTPLEGKDAGRIYRFKDLWDRPEQVEIVDLVLSY